MKLIMLDFSKKSTFENECVVEYTTKYEPMIISCKMKYNPEHLVKHKEYDADVKFWSFCWWSQRDATKHSCHISNYCLPYSFIASKIEEIVEINLDCKKPYVKYRTTLAGQQFEMTLNYGEREEDDQPIKDTFQVGDWICGLFKAQIKIQKEKKGKVKEQC